MAFSKAVLSCLEVLQADLFADVFKLSYVHFVLMSNVHRRVYLKMISLM